MIDDNAVHAMFPTEARPEAVAPAVPDRTPNDLTHSKSAAQPEADQKMFPTEDAPDPASSVAATFEPWAISAHISGNAENAAEWREAGEILAADIRDSGMSADEAAAVMDLTREAQGETAFGAVSPERLAADRARAEVQLMEEGITDSDLALARRLVDDLDAKMGGKVKAWLTGTGQGNDPRTIARAVAEAKRRGYR